MEWMKQRWARSSTDADDAALHRGKRVPRADRSSRTYQPTRVAPRSRPRPMPSAKDRGWSPARSSKPLPPRAGVWSTFGPHAIGAERFATVSSGTSLRRSPMRSCGNKPRCRTLIRMRPTRRGTVSLLVAAALQSGVHLAAARERTLGAPGVATPVPMASPGRGIAPPDLARWSRPPQHAPQLPSRRPRSAGERRRPGCGQVARTPSTVAR
jgi:hypothetical protein